MCTTNSFFRHELKRLFGKKRAVLLLLPLVISLLLLQNGINSYNATSDRTVKFLEIEKLKVSKFTTYTQMGTYGFRVIFVPSPFSVFFTDSCVIPDMDSYVDSGERLKIYNPLIGKNIFELKKSGFADFAGVLLFSISLLSLFYGYDSIKHIDYQKFLSTLSGSGAVYFSILISRVAIMFLYILLLVGSGFLLLMLNGITIAIDMYVLYFILTIFLIALFFYGLGTLLSRIKSRAAGIIHLLVGWFVLLFVIPIAVNSYISNKADLITPLYKLELEKLTILMKFEQQAIEKAGEFKYGEEVTPPRREVMMHYWANEFKKLQEKENSIRGEMRSNVSLYQLISIFIPTSNYQSVCNELSSRGYENLLRFYKSVQELKREFVKYYIDGAYFSNFSEIKPFVKGNENVYQSRSGVPRYFWLGVSVTLIYIIVLMWFSYRGYKKDLYKEPKRPMTREDIKPVTLKKGAVEVIRIVDEDFIYRLYNILSDRRTPASIKDFKGKFLINGTDIINPTYKPVLVYICLPSSIPEDIKVKDFLRLTCRLSRLTKEQTLDHLKASKILPLSNKTFAQLETWEKSLVLMQVLKIKKSEIYLVNDLARDVTVDVLIEFKDLMERYAGEGRIFIYLTTQDRPELPKNKDHPGYSPNDIWSSVVDRYKRG